MKKLILGAVVSAVLLSAAATPSFAISDEASPMSCFGQDRAEYALEGSESVGYWASMRKGLNSAMNIAYRLACQPA
jgi:hypothetical protein